MIRLLSIEVSHSEPPKPVFHGRTRAHSRQARVLRPRLAGFIPRAPSSSSRALAYCFTSHNLIINCVGFTPRATKLSHTWQGCGRSPSSSPRPRFRAPRRWSFTTTFFQRTSRRPSNLTTIMGEWQALYGAVPPESSLLLRKYRQMYGVPAPGRRLLRSVGRRRRS